MIERSLSREKILEYKSGSAWGAGFIFIKAQDV
jgi:hypothetical protein